MFSALNYRNAVISSVAATHYRDFNNRHGVTFMNTGYMGSMRSSDRSNGLLYLLITLCFMLFILLMIPSLIEPPALYIIVVFSLLTLIFIIGFTNSYLKTRRSDTSIRNAEVGRRLSNDSNNFSNNLIRTDITSDQHNNGSQLSVSSTDLPPKYELPPSYSQTIYSINI